jgi:serine/threonine protein kinase
MREGRWTTVTQSGFDHERRGLEAIRNSLPDADPWRAWSNFTFTANTGHIREIDLLVVAPGGVCMVELKNWHGTVTTENGDWVQTAPNGRRRPCRNPLHLVDQKAKELAGLLGSHGKRAYVGGAVCFTDNSLRNRLSARDQIGVYTVAELLTMLQQPPRDERRRITAVDSREIAKSLERVGIRKSDAEYKVGPYLLERQAFDSGSTWADYLAKHSELAEPARVRIYLSERGSDATIRASVESAARREAAVLRRFRHPGIVQLKQYDPSGHSAGPALIFDYDSRTLKLDEYLAQHGDGLDILGRMALVRQLAETMRSAHSSRIYHRALAARSVHVIPQTRRRKGQAAGTEAIWRSPHLQISDWQIATQRGGGSASAGTAPNFAPTALSSLHIASSSDPYLAPELRALNADPIHLDVYGLGVLTYLLVTGKPPAASQAELLAQLEAGEGLRPSAVIDGLSEDIDDLVQAATAYQPDRRLSSVDEFLEMLELVEDTLTTPSALPAAEADVPEKDPLEAVAGDVVDGRWEIRRRLGTGSTSRAFLVRDLAAEQRKTRPLAVLKVALSDSRGEVLVREAGVMRRLRADSRIINLVEREPQRIAGRTVLILEYVGDERIEGAEAGATRRHHREETVARQLREGGRLQVDQLEAYGDYLFGAVDFLEGEGVWHRDIKPDNIAVRIRPNRTRELVLIDFSLAGYPAKEWEAGTEGYLDPFLGDITRRAYDSHAERYAVAATLHQMASAELPRWGNGSVPPQMTDADEFPSPTIAADAFDPAVRDGLVAFFRKALHRDTAQRYRDLKPMRDAWRKIFLDAQRTAPSSHRGKGSGSVVARDDTVAAPAIADAEPLTVEDERNRLAGLATLDTHLSAAGLTPIAESFLYGLGVTTVGELLDYSQRTLVNRPGLGPKTRTEIQRRVREWNERLRQTPISPLSPQGRKAAKDQLAELNEVAAEAEGADSGPAMSSAVLRAVSLDTLATLFMPTLRKNGTNAKEVEMVRLLLRLPDEHGELPDIGVWPKQKDVSDALRLSAGRIPQMAKTQRTRWKRHPAVRELRAEILELLSELGRVASAIEIADALTVRRGTTLPGRMQRRALALAAVRAVVEVEQLDLAQAEFRHQNNRGATDDALAAGLLALEVRDDDAPDTPSAPGLLDYAQRLGRTADRLARQETLPTASTVLAELGAVARPPGIVSWDERRMVEVAAAASTNAAVTPRLEVYARDLPLVRALRLTQAGLVRIVPGVPEANQPGLTGEAVHDRVRARFPELVTHLGDGGHDLPIGAPLTRALHDAGFELTLGTHPDTGVQRYLPVRMDPASEYFSSGIVRRASTHSHAAALYSDDPVLRAAGRAEERLATSAQQDGYRVLTVRQARSAAAAHELAGPRFGAEQVSVTGLFLAEMHALIVPGEFPTWQTILEADAAPAGSDDAENFASYARTAWGRVMPRIAALRESGTGPLLLTDAAVFARYDAMGVLDVLAERARQGGRGLWLLVPQADAGREPQLNTVPVPYQAALGEWIELPDAWVENAHRSGARRDMVR